MFSYETLGMLSRRNIRGLSNILRRCYAATESAHNAAKESVNTEELRLTFASPVEV